jgi:hypothetical protein
MLASVEGVYRNGRIELTKVPTAIAEETAVIARRRLQVFGHLAAGK